MIEFNSQEYFTDLYNIIEKTIRQHKTISPIDEHLTNSNTIIDNILKNFEISKNTKFIAYIKTRTNFILKIMIHIINQPINIREAFDIICYTFENIRRNSRHSTIIKMEEKLKPTDKKLLDLVTNSDIDVEAEPEILNFLKNSEDNNKTYEYFLNHLWLKKIYNFLNNDKNLEEFSTCRTALKKIYPNRLIGLFELPNETFFLPFIDQYFQHNEQNNIKLDCNIDFINKDGSTYGLNMLNRRNFGNILIDKIKTKYNEKEYEIKYLPLNVENIADLVKLQNKFIIKLMEENLIK